jgi:hypothetical protein
MRNVIMLARDRAAIRVLFWPKIAATRVSTSTKLEITTLYGAGLQRKLVKSNKSTVGNK